MNSLNFSSIMEKRLDSNQYVYLDNKNQINISQNPIHKGEDLKKIAHVVHQVLTDPQKAPIWHNAMKMCEILNENMQFLNKKIKQHNDHLCVKLQDVVNRFFYFIGYTDQYESCQYKSLPIDTSTPSSQSIRLKIFNFFNSLFAKKVLRQENLYPLINKADRESQFDPSCAKETLQLVKDAVIRILKDQESQNLLKEDVPIRIVRNQQDLSNLLIDIAERESQLDLPLAKETLQLVKDVVTRIQDRPIRINLRSKISTMEYQILLKYQDSKKLLHDSTVESKDE